VLCLGISKAHAEVGEVMSFKELSSGSLMGIASLCKAFRHPRTNKSHRIEVRFKRPPDLKPVIRPVKLAIEQV
jgi:hypothetical protein